MDRAHFIIVVLAVLLFAAPADAAQPQRVLHFPSDQSVGSLSSRPARPEEPTYVPRYWYRDDDWQWLGEARGDVIVPTGHQVAFSAGAVQEWRDLSPLLKLQPDDLYQVSIHGSYVGGSKPGDSCMEYVAHLTGLRALYLHNTNISGAAMKQVRGMKDLLWLTVPARMDDKGMVFIAELPVLRGLYIKENRITDGGLAYLSKLASLEELELGGGKITDNGLVHLAQLPRLKYLLLWGKSFTNDGFRHLKNIPNIENLNLGFLHQTTDAGLAHIAEIPQVKDLSFYWSENITDEGLSCLKKLPQLRTLDVSHAKVTDVGMIHLKAIPTLEVVKLPHTGVTDKGLQYLSELPRLRELDAPRARYNDPNMDKGGYTDEGIKALSKCPLLEHLSVGGAGLTDEGIRHIARLTRMNSLYICGSARVTDASLRELAGLRSLEILDISNCRLTISGVNAFKSLTNLRTLNLDDVIQDNSGLDLSGLANLRELSFQLNRRRVDKAIVSDSFQERDIAAMGRLTGLRRLQISHEGATDAALKSLTGLKHLERLSIGGDGLTDDGLACLAELPQLNSLTLSGHFTDAGLVHLQKSQRLGLLDFMSGAGFSARALSDFRASMPHLRLYRDFEKGQELRKD